MKSAFNTVNSFRKYFSIVIIGGILGSYSCSKNSSPSVPADQKYFPQVKTILQNNCMSCHNSAGSWEGRPTAFDDDSEIVAAHASIKAAITDPVTPTNRRMPQIGQLSASDIDIMVKWDAKGGGVND
ncbi:MAG: hypothetical protein H0X33_08300 [Taibaiella sp.]|nr:hypothetical protein [Taibaiella sp.]